MRLPMPVGKQSSKGQSSAESVERVLNGYVEAVPEGKEPTPVYGTPGLTAWAATGLPGACRGWVRANAILYAVCGTKLYSFSAAGVPTELGTIPNTDQVGIDADETHVVVVTAGAIYVYAIGGALTLVTDPDAPLAGSVVAIDGFFLFGELNTEQYFICALGDPTSYDALDFASAEWKPDRLVTPLVIHRMVLLMGGETAEAVTNTGAADFPFQRYQDFFINAGIVGAQAAIVTNDTAYWLADDFTVRRLDGSTATPISTARTNRIIKAWSDKSATIASAHVHDEHLFVVFWNPDGCVVFDQSTQLWHDRASYGMDTWRASRVISCYGKTLAASYLDGKIYEVDADAFDEDGATLEFEMVTPYLYKANQRITVGELEVVTQTGEAAAGATAYITAEKTRDGKVWGIRKQRSLGRSGEYDKQVQFGPQGQARQFAWRLRITDPVRRCILGIYAEADVEP